LNDQEIEAAMVWARSKKAELFEQERRKMLADKVRAESKKPWSVAELWKYAKMRGDRIVQMETGNPIAEFKTIPFQKHIIEALLLYFTEDERFEQLDTKNYNNSDAEFALQKGLWLWGVPGVGKTLLMDMFRLNKRQCFGIVQCPKLAYLFMQSGEEVIKPHSRILENGEIFPSTPFQQKNVGICYNDLGTEPIPINHYQNKINLMEQVLLATYEKRVPFWQRHVTTNLKSEQIDEVYGARVKDRIRQMFNIIDIRGESLRK
jgi:hypothetical protein